MYAVAGLPLDDRVRAGMEAFVESHPRERHGTVVYDLEALDLDGDERREALRFYVERFGLVDEGR